MGLLWAIVRTVFTIFSIVIALLVVIDGSLLANLFNKNKGASGGGAA